MILYTCGQKTVGGYRLALWTWGSRKKDRAEIRELSGTDEVPILVLDDGEVISGSCTIAKWAKEHPARGVSSSAAEGDGGGEPPPVSPVRGRSRASRGARGRLWPPRDARDVRV